MKKMISLLLAAFLLAACCGAFASEAEGVQFASFGEAVEAAGENPAMGGTSEYMAVIVEKDGRLYRVVSMLDEKAKELDEAIGQAEDIDAAFDAFDTYVLTLPVTSVELITAEPKTQAELDAFAGKTVGELEQAGYVCTSSGTEADPERIVFIMSDGLYEYEFIADADFDTYSAKQDSNELETITVKSGKYIGVSSTAADLRIHADGTIEPEKDPFEEAPWLQELGAIFEAVQKGEKPDLDGLIQAMTEENPEAAEQIMKYAELIKSLDSDAAPETALPDEEGNQQQE